VCRIFALLQEALILYDESEHTGALPKRYLSQTICGFFILDGLGGERGKTTSLVLTLTNG